MNQRFPGFLALLVPLFLSGCAGSPPLYHLDPVLAEKMKTDDPVEIHRRFGDLSYAVDKYWMAERDGEFLLDSYQWVVRGGSLKWDSQQCTPTVCYVVMSRLVQYLPEENKLQFMPEAADGSPVPYLRGSRYSVLPTGEVASTRYEQDTGTLISFGSWRHSLVTEAEFADTRAKLMARASDGRRAKDERSAAFWNNMAAGMSGLSQATAQVSQEYAAQRAGSEALSQSIRQAQASAYGSGGLSQARVAAGDSMPPAPEDRPAAMASIQPATTSHATASTGSQPMVSGRSGSGEARNSSDDPMTCLGGAVTYPNPSYKGATVGKVTNTCARRIDIRICLLKDAGTWTCGLGNGIEPGKDYSYWGYATGEVFVDARYSGDGRKLAGPADR